MRRFADFKLDKMLYYRNASQECFKSPEIYLAIRHLLLFTEERPVIVLGRSPLKGPVPMRTLINKLLRNKSGATAIEYGLIAALISVAIVAGATVVGTQ